MGEYLVESNIRFRKTNLYIYIYMYNRSRNGIWDRARLKFDTFTDKLYRCTHVKARRILRRKRSEINSTLIEGRDRTIRVSRRGGKHARQLVGEVDRKRKKEKKKVGNKNGNAPSNTRMIPAIIHVRLPLLSSLYSIQYGS